MIAPNYELRPADPAAEEKHRFRGKCSTCRDRRFVTIVVTVGNGAAQARCTVCAAGRALHEVERDKARPGDPWVVGFDPRIHKIHPDHDGAAPELVVVRDWTPDSELEGW